MNEEEIQAQLAIELGDLTDNAFTVLRLMSMIGEIKTMAYCRGVEEMSSKLMETNK